MFTEQQIQKMSKSKVIDLLLDHKVLYHQNKPNQLNHLVSLVRRVKGLYEGLDF
jgi:iron-sulfur cluster repair protein YtfE (RIC family)